VEDLVTKGNEVAETAPAYGANVSYVFGGSAIFENFCPPDDPDIG
jgi:hypothetical protein